MLQGIIRSFVRKHSENNSRQVSYKVVKQVASDLSFPRLISFPRTGSHWLRMMMELYFEKPSLVRTFYYHKAKEFTCYHCHDENLLIRDTENVIYLYRNPINTIYSQMSYYEEDIDDRNRVEYWAKLYGYHLNKWLIEQDFTKKKTVISYENLKGDLHSEFEKVCCHFNVPLDSMKLDQVSSIISKEELKKKTMHDQQVVNLSSKYSILRKVFQDQYDSLIVSIILDINSKLSTYI